MLKNIIKLKGTVILRRKALKLIHGGVYDCNLPRKCFEDSDCCSGVCGVEKIINGRPITISVCAF